MRVNLDEQTRVNFDERRSYQVILMFVLATVLVLALQITVSRIFPMFEKMGGNSRRISDTAATRIEGDGVDRSDLSLLDLKAATVNRPAWLGGRVLPSQGTVVIQNTHLAFGPYDLSRPLLDTLRSLVAAPNIRLVMPLPVDLISLVRSSIRSRHLRKSSQATSPDDELIELVAWHAIADRLGGDETPDGILSRNVQHAIEPGSDFSEAELWREWAALTAEERLVLVQVAEEGYVSFRHQEVLSLLTGRGWFVLDPAPRFVEGRKREFVRAARLPAEIAEMERSGQSRARRTLEGIILGFGLLILVALYFFQPSVFSLALAGLTTLGAGFSRVGPVVSGFLQYSAVQTDAGSLRT